MATHAQLPDSGRTAHHTIDERLPSEREKARLREIAENAPVTVSGARDDPEGALEDLLDALEDLGLITDNTTAS
jgi:hypothetical protein